MGKYRSRISITKIILLWPFLLMWLFLSALWSVLSAIAAPIGDYLIFPVNPKRKNIAITGHDYEYYVAEYLRSRGYHGVKVTKASGDYGIDVVANKNGRKYAVQCKYYSSPVGIKAVQEAVAGKVHYGCNASMVVTNNTFTDAAKTLAFENDVILLSNVGSSNISYQRSKSNPIKTVIVSLYLFFAAVIIYTTYEVSKTTPFSLDKLWEYIQIAFIVTFPLWAFRFIRLVFRLVKTLVSK